MDVTAAQREGPFYLGILEALPIPVFVIDKNFRIVFANKGFLNTFGVLENSLVGRILWECWCPEKFSHLKREYEEIFATKQTKVIDHRSVEMGHDFELWVTWHDDHLIVVCVDVTIYVRHEKLIESEFKAIQSIMDELQSIQSEALTVANTDDLTGLCTRRRVDEIASQVFPALAARNLPVSLIMFDIDHFKRFNDTYGHAEGDKVLKLVGRAMIEFQNDHETVCRFGGEEFLVVCPRIGVRKAVLRANELLEVIRGIQGAAAPITASFGVAGIGRKETDWTLTLGRADKALYLAKSRGRNCVVPWTSVNDGSETLPEAA